MNRCAAPTEPQRSQQPTGLASGPRGPSTPAPLPVHPQVYYLVMRSKLGRGMDPEEVLEYPIAETTTRWRAVETVIQSYEDDVARRSEAALDELVVWQSYDHRGIRRYRMLDGDGMEFRVWVELRSAPELDDWVF
ncbi:uncharacterized protein L3040_000711 [Drepanopeziza brunnea f. sp. 'multigermtubi']|uniref:Uncharacterized protein n=1 Tax=Marssonina brunnea f. sp. multigermtubi (strain MB_m1) TaxID=1072389 RepID=K1XKY3_MARBU|nr:uncharacterized protein MBM_00361 [Drepanopeziza brunnea f. sp. 'multigermtubi' MB_m1]EKD21248.1 hypothetical protein MBM_00361 [Drepanopeziza brunnea f. sp. 'multigermtubi' MB_m1]KAJ5054437.1 hypothetical protein L3040_000711 [Drepanopeziza brunnea f. sp. 'multigermtubi']